VVGQLTQWVAVKHLQQLFLMSRFMQFGLSTQSSTPTVSAPVNSTAVNENFDELGAIATGRK
jgi:hypothetical protein